MNKTFLTVLELLLVILIPLSSFSATLVDKVVAVVNDEIITLSELQEEVEKINRGLEQKIEQKIVLDSMIERKILVQEATNKGVSISEEELDLTVKEMKRRFNLNEKDIESELEKQNIKLEELKEHWYYQLLSRKLLDSQLRGKIAVGEDEIAEYYKENYGGEIESAPQVKIAHILIPLNEENAFKKAEEILSLARSGENFAELVKKYSKDSASVSKGGELGYFKKGDLVLELEQAIEQTKVREFTGPIKTQAGYHVVKVLERKESDALSFGGYKEEIKQIIYSKKYEKLIKDWEEQLRKTAHVEIKI